MYLDQASEADLNTLQQTLEAEFTRLKAAGLKLDLTRGKPSAEQLDLSNPLDGILAGNYLSDSGEDARNYGGLDGLVEVKALFSAVLDVGQDEILIGGNSSLTLMYQSIALAVQHGFSGPGSAWRNNDSIRFLCPVPGYDRHFSVCEEFGIEMIPVAMNDDGPDMDAVEKLVREDPLIKGIWCVPRFSNPSGIVYADAVVDRLAALPKLAGEHFMLMWDNAYAVHALHADAPQLKPVMAACKQAGTENQLLQFGSTSKITFAGAGVAFMASSAANLATFRKHLVISSIGPDKVNQLRHLRFLRDMDGIKAHMARHAAILKPKFDAVLAHLQENFAQSDMGRWTVPEGGYFVSFDSRPGLAREIVELAAEAGVKLTPAGATFPYGKDPQDSNIRLAPSFPTIADINKAMEVFVLCVRLASVRQKLAC